MSIGDREAIGTWRWAELGPNFALPAGNPPSGIAAGYCLFDALALRLGPRLLRLWRARPARLAPSRRAECEQAG